MTKYGCEDAVTLPISALVILGGYARYRRRTMIFSYGDRPAKQRPWCGMTLNY